MKTRIKNGATGRSEWYLLSTDPLPTAEEGPMNADPAYIMDAKAKGLDTKMYLYDQENDTWLPQ